MKSNKGFSLVELIVVIAIMAIIAAVAVPVYNTYIDKAEDGNVQNIVDEAKYALELAEIEYGVNGTIAESATAKTVEITFADADDDAAVKKAVAQLVSIIPNATAADDDLSLTFTVKYDISDNIEF